MSLFDDRNTLLGKSRYLSYLQIANSCGALMRLAQELKADFLMIPAGDLKMSGCLVPLPTKERETLKADQDTRDGIEPCFGEPVLLQRPNYRDAVAVIFRVPPVSGA